ncbi:hypothetical protein EF384_05980 [Aerococcus agrisoli]|uniref:DUF2798 domain-containing protein n=1 Tax=Aerococcus agrisoli TaxID=2487350 RepID=A0A3N4GEY0_9LACT|nr:hypothetical protein [Aerococcus agrisoli]RPA60448.1 hypothetical protein EF384_05980 [Aerococcus agrisoli]
MDFHMKLPRSGKDFVIFLLIVSLISVNTIGPTITMYQMGFSLETWKMTLKVLPFIWIAVVILVLLTHPIAEKMTQNFLSEGDSFNATLTVNILFNVFLMSISMTIIGTWIGMGQISWLPFQTFHINWPRNFAIAFAIEALVAQPIARQVLFMMHKRQDAQAVAED